MCVLGLGYTHIDTNTCARAHWVCVHGHARVNFCVYRCMWICVCMHMPLHICVCSCMCVHVCARTHAHVCIHVHLFTCSRESVRVHECMCACTCVLCVCMRACAPVRGCVDVCLGRTCTCVHDACATEVITFVGVQVKDRTVNVLLRATGLHGPYYLEKPSST